MGLGRLILRSLTSDGCAGFFDAINLGKGTTLEERCNTFAYKGRSNSNWAFNNIIRFLYYQKERVEKKEITAGTLHNLIGINLFLDKKAIRYKNYLQKLIKQMKKQPSS
jgi:mannosyltransferase OCH1-like enzyme